jgi:short-subunit dehydrogenase
MILWVGAKEGISGALCKKAAEDGCHVVVVGRTTGKLNLVAEEIREMGAAISTFVAVSLMKTILLLFLEH